jgi:hypothetical protein
MKYYSTEELQLPKKLTRKQVKEARKALRDAIDAQLKKNKAVAK